jgi:hypothetical protein
LADRRDVDRVGKLNEVEPLAWLTGVVDRRARARRLRTHEKPRTGRVVAVGLESHEGRCDLRDLQDVAAGAGLEGSAC